MSKRHKPRQIAPRLASGEKRVHGSIGLPPNIKQALRMVGVVDNKSVSWILENVILDRFRNRPGFERPEYKKPKQKENA